MIKILRFFIFAGVLKRIDKTAEISNVEV